MTTTTARAPRPSSARPPDRSGVSGPVVTGWAGHHRRSAVLRSVVAELDRTRDGQLPYDASAAEVFPDRADLLRALHQVWARRLTAAVDTAIELADGDAAPAVVRVWGRCAEAMPGLRALLDRYAGDPALAHGELVEHRTLAVAAGLASLSDPWARSAALGAGLASSARAASSRPSGRPATRAGSWLPRQRDARA